MALLCDFTFLTRGGWMKLLESETSTPEIIPVHSHYLLDNFYAFTKFSEGIVLIYETLKLVGDCGKD